MQQLKARDRAASDILWESFRELVSCCQAMAFTWLNACQSPMSAPAYSIQDGHQATAMHCLLRGVLDALDARVVELCTSCDMRYARDDKGGTYPGLMAIPQQSTAQYASAGAFWKSPKTLVDGASSRFTRLLNLKRSSTDVGQLREQVLPGSCFIKAEEDPPMVPPSGGSPLRPVLLTSDAKSPA
eukprot:5362595-Amphidinium_carterae.1